MRRTGFFAATGFAALSIVLSACNTESDPGTSAAGGSDALDLEAVRATFATEFGATKPGESQPADLVDLGRELYHAEQLSLKGNLSCASCHKLDAFGQDNEPTSPGSTGERGERNSPASVNAFRQLAQFWDGRAPDVETQAQGPILNPIEHGFAKPDEFLAALKAIDGIEAKFQAAFPGDDDPVTVENFGRAVGAFERTLWTKSRFDALLDGDDNALTAEEKAGLKTFMEVGCITCHNGRTVGGGMYQKLGLVQPYETEDKGRGAHTGNAAEDYFFKVPMLLNVAETAPYFHDGSVKTLEEAVRLMAKHQLGKQLTDEQVASIVTFLKSLTGDPQW